MEMLERSTRKFIKGKSSLSIYVHANKQKEPILHEIIQAREIALFLE